MGIFVNPERCHNYVTNVMLTSSKNGKQTMKEEIV